MGASSLESYVRSGRKRVEGWFARADAETFRTVLAYQQSLGLKGAGAEIGVHHGKAFIAICLALAADERAYCVDVFDQQQHNLDHSGKGDLETFLKNLDAFGVARSQVEVRAASSMTVTADEIRQAVGPVRFFSVDGGHWAEIVENDLDIALGCLAPHGVIALDDFHRPEWPDVTAGYMSWRARQAEPLEPFAIGFNKLYLCHAPYRAAYETAVLRNPLLAGLVVKRAVLQGVEVPVFGSHLVPDFPIWQHALDYLRVTAPETFARLRRLRRG